MPDIRENSATFARQPIVAFFQTGIYVGRIVMQMIEEFRNYINKSKTSAAA